MTTDRVDTTTDSNNRPETGSSACHLKFISGFFLSAVAGVVFPVLHCTNNLYCPEIEDYVKMGIYAFAATALALGTAEAVSRAYNKIDGLVRQSFFNQQAHEQQNEPSTILSMSP